MAGAKVQRFSRPEFDNTLVVAVALAGCALYRLIDCATVRMQDACYGANAVLPQSSDLARHQRHPSLRQLSYTHA